MLRKSLKLLGAFVAILVLVLIGVIGWYAVQANKYNGAALARAEAVCAKLRPGDALESLVAAAEASDGIYLSHDANLHAAAFHGYIYDHAECRVTVENGAVISKEVIMVHE